MKEIELSNYGIALVDDDDYPAVSDWTWHAQKNRSGNVYAMRSASPHNPYAAMHRMIVAPPPGFDVDHINGDGLDNRRSNLRLATRRQNSYNRVGRVGKRTKGVSYIPRLKKYRAYIVIDNYQTNLGCYTHIEDAATAYDEAAKRLHGPFARLNNLQRAA